METGQWTYGYSNLNVNGNNIMVIGYRFLTIFNGKDNLDLNQFEWFKKFKISRSLSP